MFYKGFTKELGGFKIKVFRQAFGTPFCLVAVKKAEGHLKAICLAGKSKQHVLGRLKKRIKDQTSCEQ